MKVVELNQLQTTPIKDIPEGVTQPGVGRGVSLSLQQYDGTNVVQWFASYGGGGWSPVGNVMVYVANKTSVLK